MIKISKTETFGWEAAIRGCRNSYQSWDKSDSAFASNAIKIGSNDLDLLARLSKAGSSHAKFMRMIHVQCDILAPLYWWKEFDTYKVGTVANSTSTMHSIQNKELSVDDFSVEHLRADELEMLKEYLKTINSDIALYNDTTDEVSKATKKNDWWQIIQMLPTSYNQLRTVDLNYAVLNHICRDRFGHRLDEWLDFCKWLTTLPYGIELIY